MEMIAPIYETASRVFSTAEGVSVVPGETSYNIKGKQEAFKLGYRTECNHGIQKWYGSTHSS